MAHQLAARFEGPYPPKGGSGFHQRELGFSALARQGLKRRLPTQAPFADQVHPWSRQGQAQQLPSRWPFTVPHARQALTSQ